MQEKVVLLSASKKSLSRMSLGDSEEKSLLTLIIREEFFVCFVSLEKRREKF